MIATASTASNEKEGKRKWEVHRCRHVGKSSMRCCPLVARVTTLETEIDTTNERYIFALAKRLFTLTQVFSSSSSFRIVG